MVSFKVNLSDYFYFGRVIKMTEVMLTSGQGFEGYEIVEYLGFVNVQSVLSSNFFKGFAAGVSEMS